MAKLPVVTLANTVAATKSIIVNFSESRGNIIMNFDYCSHVEFLVCLVGSQTFDKKFG